MRGKNICSCQRKSTPTISNEIFSSDAENSYSVYVLEASTSNRLTYYFPPLVSDEISRSATVQIKRRGPDGSCILIMNLCAFYGFMKQYHPPWRLWITIRLVSGASSLLVHSSLLAALTTFADRSWRMNDWSIHTSLFCPLPKFRAKIKADWRSRISFRCSSGLSDSSSPPNN